MPDWIVILITMVGLAMIPATPRTPYSEEKQAEWNKYVDECCKRAVLKEAQEKAERRARRRARRRALLRSLWPFGKA